MSDLLCDKDETSEDGSTNYSDYCDDDMIRGAGAATLTRPDATQSQLGGSSPLPQPQDVVVLGKRKAPDGADSPVSVVGPSTLYSYKRRFLSDSIETDSVIAPSEATTLDSTLDSHHSDDTIVATQSGDDSSAPYHIVSSVKIGPLLYF